MFVHTRTSKIRSSHDTTKSPALIGRHTCSRNHRLALDRKRRLRVEDHEIGIVPDINGSFAIEACQMRGR